MKIGFYSCMTGMPWGGSEELWWRAARLLQSTNHEVTVNYKWWPRKAGQLIEIEQHGGDVWLRNQPKSYLEVQRDNFKRLLTRNGARQSWLQRTRPDVVMVTLGYHPDRIPIADECQRMKIPYAINVQCASSFFFIHSDNLTNYRRWYQGARKVYFVSDENQQKLQNNIACALSNAEIVANPFNVDYTASPTWPQTNDTFRLACVGRIHFQSKGQDLIVDVMKQQKWRSRPLEITFYGHDQGQLQQLKDLIALHGLQDRLKIGGFVDDVAEIWEHNHALLLPSRYEGAPLVVIEAMLCNRIGIVTDIGRNRELIDDGQSGFVADGPFVRLLDDALERAWQRRNEWQAMGQLAGRQIRERYPEDPIREFADRILHLAPDYSLPGTAAGNPS